MIILVLHHKSNKYNQNIHLKIRTFSCRISAKMHSSSREGKLFDKMVSVLSKKQLETETRSNHLPNSTQNIGSASGLTSRSGLFPMPRYSSGSEQRNHGTTHENSLSGYIPMISRYRMQQERLRQDSWNNDTQYCTSEWIRPNISQQKERENHEQVLTYADYIKYTEHTTPRDNTSRNNTPRNTTSRNNTPRDNAQVKNYCPRCKKCVTEPIFCVSEKVVCCKQCIRANEDNFPVFNPEASACSICYNDFDNNEIVRVGLKQTGQIYCKKCIEKWLTEHNTCPNTKTELTTKQYYVIK